MNLRVNTAPPQPKRRAPQAPDSECSCTIRTRFSTLPDLIRAMPILVREDGKLFVPAKDAPVQIGDSLAVVFTTFDSRSSVDRVGVVESTNPDAIYSGGQPGILFRMLPWDPPPMGDEAEPAPEPVPFADESRNPFAGLDTNMLSLFVECNLKETEGEVSRSYDDIPCYAEPATSSAPTVAPELPPIPVHAAAPARPMPLVESEPMEIADEDVVAEPFDPAPEDWSYQPARRSPRRAVIAVALGVAAAAAGAVLFLHPPRAVPRGRVARVASVRPAAVAATREAPPAAEVPPAPAPAEPVAAAPAAAVPAPAQPPAPPPIPAAAPVDEQPAAAAPPVAAAQPAAEPAAATPPPAPIAAAPPEAKPIAAAAPVATAQPVAPAAPVAAPPVAAAAPTAEAATGTCRVKVVTRPTGAEVLLAGRSLGHTPTRPLEVPCGASLTLKRPRYQVAAATAPAQPSAGVQEIAAKLERPGATLEVTSQPPGAKVRIHGRTVGQTPALLSVPEFDLVRFEIQADGFAPFKKQLYLRSASARFHADLVPTTVAAEPGP
jgi:PEGA domain-containing protein